MGTVPQWQRFGFYVVDIDSYENDPILMQLSSVVRCC